MVDMELERDRLPPVEAAACPTRTEKFVTFHLGETLYAVLAAAVAEVTHPLPVTSLPNAPAALMGISPLRGEIIASMDLRRLLCDVPPGSISPKSKQLVFKRRSAEALPIAFTADRLGEIVTLDLSEIRPEGSGNGYLAGVATVDDRNIMVIDHSKLAAAIEPI
jgi:purine-binding chemotaxis protein CheW